METLTELAGADRRVTLVVGDLGFGVVEGFAARFPRQYVNAGVSEQNMAGLAAGMAMCGRIVFTYSIANFPTLRCLEQIRNDVCYHRANVKVVAVGGGYCYGALGVTHHATEDLAVLRAIPELTVVSPGDPREARAATRALANTEGPAYLRLGRAGEPEVHARDIEFEIGKAIVARDYGTEATIIATGGMLHSAVAVADALSNGGVKVRVLSMHTVKPIDSAAVEQAAATTGAVLTLEEHSVLGGLGGAVAEVLAELGASRIRFKRLGLPVQFTKEVGSQEYLRARHGLDAKSLVAAIGSFIAGSRDLAIAVT